MGYLLDTNVISELRKGDRCDERVRAWYSSLRDTDLWLSVLVIAEIRQGVEKLRRKDPESAAKLERWLEGLVRGYGDRILPVTRSIAERWGVLNAGNPVPYVDGFLAATAIEHGLTLATRNVSDIRATGVSFINPFGS
jgi:toxin FitB